jgi:PAS domain S-box-containing protein
LGTVIPDASRVQEHFHSLLAHCPLPVLILDGEARVVLGANDAANLPSNSPVDQIIETTSLLGLRSLHCAPGESRTITLTRCTPPNSTPSTFTIRCEEAPGGPVYVLVESAQNSAQSGRDPEQPRRAESSDHDLRQQELRFRALADSVPVGIFLTNADGRVMYVNGLWSSIIGLSFNQAVAHGWLSALHPDDRGRVQQAWHRFLTLPGPFEAEFRCVAGGVAKWVAARATIFTNEKGEPAGFLGTFSDVTSHHEAEDRLKTSEARYRSIFENVIDVYYETSLTGEIMEVSPSIDALGGYTRSELLGRQMLGFYADPSARAKLLEQLVAGHGLHDYEIALRDKNGRAIACSISCKLERNENGEPVKIIGSMRDISQRKAVEEMLRLERENLELIARDVPLPKILESIVFAVEAQANGMRCSVLLADAEGKRLTLGAAPSLPTEYNRAVEGIAIAPEVGSCGSAAAMKERVIVEDIALDPRWAAFRELALAHDLRACWSEPILSPNGRVLGTFAMYYPKPMRPSREDLQVVSAAARLAAVAIERTHAEEEQRSLEAQMRQAQKLESLGVLAGGIAHDFNNLLTGILGYASLAANALRESGTPAYRHVREIEKVAQRAAGLTKQMLAYSGKGRFLIMPIDLSVSVEELAHLLSISITKKARLHYDFQQDIPLVEADPAQVQQVVMNLITNASEALGDQPGDITIATGVLHASREYLAESYLDVELPEGEYVYADVVDTGCGMDKDTLARIFDPFFTTKFTGRGLGMSAVLGIMKGHRGTIKVQSAPGQGTTVRLLFPALARSAEVAPETPLITDVVRRDQWAGNGTILVVDDEATIRGLAAAILAEDGFKVLTAIDGEQALEIYNRQKSEIDAILLDLTMPTKDGVETLRELRAGGSEVAVILSSGYNEQEVAKRINGDRFDAFVQKPYSREALLACLHEVLAAR